MSDLADIRRVHQGHVTSEMRAKSKVWSSESNRDVSQRIEHCKMQQCLSENQSSGSKDRLVCGKTAADSIPNSEVVVFFVFFALLTFAEHWSELAVEGLVFATDNTL